MTNQNICWPSYSSNFWFFSIQNKLRFWLYLFLDCLYLFISFWRQEVSRWPERIEWQTIQFSAIASAKFLSFYPLVWSSKSLQSIHLHFHFLCKWVSNTFSCRVDEIHYLSLNLSCIKLHLNNLNVDSWRPDRMENDKNFFFENKTS